MNMHVSTKKRAQRSAIGLDKGLYCHRPRRTGRASVNEVTGH